ncbi:unnamed protein product [Allacma fusca]|uniref:RING-type domain-containing protein n=1 Tax=Allacma fusca TaxID=39272 RepID=A0A8J2K4C3_9HEXA|nr:unnamed protein product [Allacma fusca]
MAGENFITRQPEPFPIVTNRSKISHQSKDFCMKVNDCPYTVIEIENQIKHGHTAQTENSDFEKAQRCYHYTRNGRQQLFPRSKKRRELSPSKRFAKCKRNRLYPQVEKPVRRIIDTTVLSGRPESSSQHMISEEQMYRQLDLLSRECVDLSRARNKNVDGIPLLICIIMLIIAALLVYFIIEELQDSYSTIKRNSSVIMKESSRSQKLKAAARIASGLPPPTGSFIYLNFKTEIRMQDANTISRKFTVLNQLVNPLQSRCSFSESDLQKLFPSRKKKRLSERDLHDYLQRINSTASKLSGTSGSESNEEQNVTVSISDIIKENNLSENITSKNQLSHLIYTVFIGIFYKAVKSHFVCPICNELLRKPKMLPACGHMFCSHCLAAWFTNSSLRSCPVCRKFSALNQAPVPNCTVRTFIEKTEKLRKYFKDQRGRRDDHQNHALLTILGLPPNETNQSLIAYLTPGYQSFESKSLQNIQRKWVFEQLFHNLRFAQRQDTNRFFVTKPPSVTALQIYRQQILQGLCWQY